MAGSAAVALSTPSDDLERVLQLAAMERAARHSPRWSAKVEGAIEDAMDAHSEAVDNLYAELYRLLDARNDSGDPVPKMRIPPDPRKELKKQIVARVREELPSLVASIIDEF